MEENNQKQTGTVKWFDPTKGYGFIAPDAGGEDVFAHVNNLMSEVDPNQLTEGTRVEFNVGEGRDGRSQATEVALATEAVMETEAVQA